MEKKNIFFLTLLLVINYIHSQLADFKMGETREEKIVNRAYYRVELTDRVSEYVIVSVKPSDDYEKYSDPDIFVSKVK